MPFPKQTKPKVKGCRRQRSQPCPSDGRNSSWARMWATPLHSLGAALSPPTLNVTAVPQESIDYIDPRGGTGYIFMRQETAVLKSYIKEGHRWRWLVGNRDTLGFLHHHLHLSDEMYAGLKCVYQSDLVVRGLIISMCYAPATPHGHPYLTSPLPSANSICIMTLSLPGACQLSREECGVKGKLVRYMQNLQLCV